MTRKIQFQNEIPCKFKKNASSDVQNPNFFLGLAFNFSFLYQYTR